MQIDANVMNVIIVRNPLSSKVRELCVHNFLTRWCRDTMWSHTAHGIRIFILVSKRRLGTHAFAISAANVSGRVHGDFTFAFKKCN